MKKLRFGILGVALIAVEKVIPALRRAANCEVVAIASRELSKAQAAAKVLNIGRAHGSYDALLADPEVDAIYNPLPNQLHVPWSIKALEAGKHVLCEKPLSMSVAEAETLVAAGARHPHLKLMEAFMYRFHPQWIATRAWVQSGQIGQLRSIQSFFSYFNRDPANVRNRADCGGGSLMDIGCYPISVSRFLFGGLPRRVLGWTENDPNFKVDRLASGVLEFSTGTSTFTCGTQLVSYQRVNVFGTEGRIEIEIPFNAPPDRPCRVWLQRGEEIEEHQFATTDQYTLQGEAFARAVLEDMPVPTPIQDGVENMHVIEALFRSAAEQTWVPL